jgi:hypothetical protein
MWGSHFAYAEERMFTTANSRVDQGQMYRTPLCPAARGSKSTAHKIVKELPHFRDAASALLSGIPT